VPQSIGAPAVHVPMPSQRLAVVALPMHAPGEQSVPEP
jgi:hypothetical protein